MPRPFSELKLFQADFEIDEMVGSQRSYAGPVTALIIAADAEEAERILLKKIKDSKKMLTEPEECSYQIHSLPRRAGIKVMSGML